MGRFLEKIWVRFGLYVTLSVFITLSAVVTFAMWSDAREKEIFMNKLPPAVKIEMLNLLQISKEHNQKIDVINQKYGLDTHEDISAMTVFGMFLSIFIGLIGAFFSARIFARPLTSVIETALKIAQGNLSARATALKGHGELTTLTQNFNFMADSLERLERERRETVAAMSHELRTPLTILQGRLHALCDGVIPQSPQESLRLLHQTEHLVRLVDDMHTLSLVEAGRFSLNCSYIELGSFIHDVMPFYLQKSKSYEVDIQLDAETVFVNADKDRLRQVLTNLVQNALHYGSAGSLIKIRVARENENALIEIRDRGPGIDITEIQFVFNSFFRGNTETTKGKSGSGLGLAIVSSIVKQHGGTITVHNHPDGGACFQIYLPIATNN